MKNKTKRKKIFSWIIKSIIIAGAFAGLFFAGFFAGKSMKNDGGSLSEMSGAEFASKSAAVLAFFFIGFFIHMIIHEFGHLIAGKLSGYQFISFRVFNVTLIKENGKLRRKKFSVAGTGGQCLMIPPEEKDGKYPFLLYNLGGSLMNFLISLILLALFFTLNSDSFIFSAALIPLIVTGAFTGLINIIPLKFIGIANDGYNTYLLLKNEEDRRALRVILLSHAYLAAGKRVRNLPAEWSLHSDEFGSSLSTTSALIHCSILSDNHNFAEARELTEKILTEADIFEYQKNELRCDLLFFEIILERRREEIDRLYTDKLRKYISQSRNHPCRLRLLYAYSKLVEPNEEEAAKTLEEFNKACGTYPYETESEREYIAIIDGISENLAIGQNLLSG